MRIYQLPVRETCRAGNAFNVRHALLAAFRAESTAAEVTLDNVKDPESWNTPLKHKHIRPQAQRQPSKRPAAQFGGGFANYESLTESFRGRRQRGIQPESDTVQVTLEAGDDASLQAPASSPSGDSQAEQPEVPTLKKQLALLQQKKKGPRGKSRKPKTETEQLQPDKEYAQQHEAEDFQEKRSVVRITRARRNDDWKTSMQEIGALANELAHQKRSPTEKEKAKFLYRGQIISPQSSAMKLPLPLPWAVDPTDVQGPKDYNRLEHEIARFVAYAEPTPAEKAARQAVAEQARQYIVETLHEKNVVTEIFGSEMTTLASATSDIDIRIYDGARSEEDQKYHAFGNVMRVLFDKMESDPDWICVVFRHSKYPIISAQHKATGIDLQIVCSPSTQRQQEMTAKYLTEIPNLRSLFFVLRTMLSMRGLVDVFNGGTGSYGLFMMLVASLRRRSSKHAVNMPASEQLLHFLDFYSEHRFGRYGLAIEPVGKLFQKHNGGNKTPIQSYIQAAHRRDEPIRAGQWAIGQRRAAQPYLLCLQDPADPTNDLGRKSNAIKHLVATIRWSRNLLSGAHETMVAERQSRESLLLPVVGRCHEVYFERRKRVEKYGNEVLKARAEAQVQENGAHEEGERSGEASKPVQAAAASL